MIKIWDDHNKQWLEPMEINFGKDGSIWRVVACKHGEDPLSDGWYNLIDNDLKKIAIIGDIRMNVELIPKPKVCKNCKSFQKDTPQIGNNNCLAKSADLAPLPELNVDWPNVKQGDVIGHSQGVHVGEEYSCDKFDEK